MSRDCMDYNDAPARGRPADRPTTFRQGAATRLKRLRSQSLAALSLALLAAACGPASHAAAPAASPAAAPATASAPAVAGGAPAAAPTAPLAPLSLRTSFASP